jgi:hypothetical protein
LGLPRPDKVVFLDMPLEIAQQLLAARYEGDEGKKDIHERNVAYLRQLIMDMKNTLKSVRAEDVLRHDTPYYRIDTNLVRCDYLSFLETGKPQFHGEYMTQYSWAEETCAMLQFKK